MDEREKKMLELAREYARAMSKGENTGSRFDAMFDYVKAEFGNDPRDLQSHLVRAYVSWAIEEQPD